MDSIQTLITGSDQTAPVRKLQIILVSSFIFLGTHYEFRIYTENELFLSANHALAVCKTLDRGRLRLVVYFFLYNIIKLRNYG